MPIYGIVLIIAAVLIGSVLVTAWIFSGMIIHARRQPILKTPADYNMDYEDIEFEAIDGVKLSGWFIPSDSPGKVIIMTHPYPFNRHGFRVKGQGFPPLAWTDVDLLTTAQALHGAGYSVLMFDFRNHGQSGKALTGVGLEEYKDVLGAVTYLKQHPTLNDPPIGFVSFCMGANSTIVALSKGGDLVADIAFLVAIQPISANVFVRSYLKAVYTPLSLFLMPLVDWLVQLRGGHPLREMSPLSYAADITIPSLFVQAREDRWTELQDIESIYDAVQGPKEFWWLEGRMKRFDAYNLIGEQPDRVLQFIEGKF